MKTGVDMKVDNNRITAIIMSVIVVAMTSFSTLTGCTESGKGDSNQVSVAENDDKNGKENAENITDPDKTEDNNGNKTDDNSGIGTENGNKQGSEEVKNTAEESEGETTMDPITRMEYDKSRILAKTDYYNSLDNSCPQTWCFQRKKDHSPSGTYENFKIADYNGVYLDENAKPEDKVIYLTFDCGYPSDLTVKILDTLKKHNAKASFFVTQMYLEECADYAKRMKEEGHMVCNHTVTHTDLVKRDVEGVCDEIVGVAEYFYQVTGYEFDPYLRTPTGSYSKKLMTIIKDAGYMTVFWSIAYGDYDPKNQPAPGYVTDHFATYHHNGAIALMHNDSPSNANELDAVLTELEKEGYRFALLDELYIKNE